MEILRKLGQLVDFQKDLLQAIRDNNNSTNTNTHAHAQQLTPATQHNHQLPPSPAVASSSFAHDGRLPHPRPDQASSWTFPVHRNSSSSPPRFPHLRPDIALGLSSSTDGHRPDTPYDQGRSGQPTFTDTNSGAFALAENPAALRWFGLLTNDAAREATQVTECEPEPDWGFLDENDFTGATPLQRATRIVDGAPDARDSISDGVSQPDNIGLPARLSERRLWQAKDSIPMLPQEKVLFENFVRRISLWVCVTLS